MQNEITELRNQVRTLKRIVCLVCCLFGVFMFIGCSSRGANMNRGGTYTSDNSDGGVLISVAIGLILEILDGEDEEIHKTPNDWPTQPGGGFNGTWDLDSGTPTMPPGGGTTPPSGYQTNLDAPTSNPEHNR